MADRFIVDVDASGVTAAMDAAVAAMQRRCHAASGVTAQNIAREQRARVARRTGRTGDAITVDEINDQQGWRVYVDPAKTRPAPVNVPIWNEYGTKFMSPRAFFFPAVRIEEGPHERRIREALQEGVDEVGLGE